MPEMPSYLPAAFIVITLVTLFLLVLALYGSEKTSTRKRTWQVAAVLLLWVLLQSMLALKGTYSGDPRAMPPKIILLGVWPALLLIAFLFFSGKGRGFIDSLPLLLLTYIHTIRIPVELVLYGLFLNGAVPELMTFEGRNFDIAAGISAPLVAYLGISRGWMNRKLLLVWNFICLALLLNIVINAVLSAPSPFQRFAFEQPNLAILYFPYNLLPAFVVPVVLFSHLASIRQLMKEAKGNG